MAVGRIETDVPWRISRADGEHWLAIFRPLELTVDTRSGRSWTKSWHRILNAVPHDLLSTSDWLSSCEAKDGRSTVGQAPGPSDLTLRLSPRWFSRVIPRLSRDREN